MGTSVSPFCLDRRLFPFLSLDVFVGCVAEWPSLFYMIEPCVYGGNCPQDRLESFRAPPAHRRFFGILAVFDELAEGVENLSKSTLGVVGIEPPRLWPFMEVTS
jgi:hypothetical protein